MNDSTLNSEAGIVRILRSPVALKVAPLLFFTVLFTLFFSPIILTDYLLAPHDGLRYSLPNFYSERTLWTNLLFAGYPAAADPQAQTWYPLAFLFSLFPNSWNAYMISAYVLSACFMFGYVWTATQSRMAGLVAGIAFSMSGFMIGRLGQPPLLHAAIWLPLIFWALEKNRQKFSMGWIAIGSFAIACSFLGGHPQITFFGLIVASAYVVYMGRTLAHQRWSYFKRFAFMVLMGMGLIGIQLLPTMELADWSARSELSYSEFIRFSPALSEMVTLFFPYLFGGGGGTLYDAKYFGSGNGVEVPGYLGLLTLLLAALAVAGSSANRLVRFWLVTFLIGLVLALGEQTPLSQILFHLPGYNKFRGPLRHFLEISLAVSVLAGLGADCIQRRKISSAQIKGVVLGVVGVFGLGLALIWIFSDTLEQLALQKNVESLPVVSWKNTSMWVPVSVMTLAVGALIFWWNRPGGRASRFLLLVVLVIDMGSFGWFHHWRHFVPPAQMIQPSEAALRYQAILNESHQRLVPVEGIHGENDQFPVNLSRIWGIPSATGYNPLVLSRVNEVLARYESGALVDTWSSVKHRALDILGVRYLFLSSAYMETFKNREGLQWTREDLGIRLGNGCNQAYPSSIEFSIPHGFSASSIGMVSKSYCSGNISDGEAVLNIRLSGDNGLKHRADFVMGRDTAEWAYDCVGVKGQVRHRQASVFEDYEMRGQAGDTCHGNQYVTRVPISPGRSWKRVQVTWSGKPGVVQLDKITLIDEKSGRVLPLRELTASDHWRFKEQIGETAVYENLDAMPRAWMVPEALPARPQDILHAIYYSKLPDGRPFDPKKTALIEEAYSFQATSFDPSGKVDVVRLEDTEIVLKTQSASDSFLVTSDIYYPGWEATIDGQPTPLYRTDYVLRGISLPKGSHEVRFKFHSQPFYTGITVTLLSLLILALSVFRTSPRKNT